MSGHSRDTMNGNFDQSFVLGGATGLRAGRSGGGGGENGNGSTFSEDSVLGNAALEHQEHQQSRAESMVEAAARMLLGEGTDGLTAGSNSSAPPTVRPRRPATQKRAGAEEREESQAHLRIYEEERARHAHRRRGRRREGRNTKRSQSLEESLNSLRNFAKTNKGRRLAETTTKGLVSSVGHHQPDSPADGVHYVNIIEDSPEGSTGHNGKGDNVSRSASNSSSATLSSTTGGFVRRTEIALDGENASGGGKVRLVPSSNAFVMPTEPRGKKLTVNILSTWGDPHYVGLMGLEVYDGSGHVVELTSPDKQLWADPADVNVLDGYGNDPRTVHNLVDGKNFTCDDLHAWLAPFEPGDDHFIHMVFDVETSVSVIRIWNYNKSRIHAYRGARYVEITLDDEFIYRGEIKRATGSTKEGHRACSETLCFTRNKHVLKLIDKYDRAKYPGAGSDSFGLAGKKNTGKAGRGRKLKRCVSQASHGRSASAAHTLTSGLGGEDGSDSEGDAGSGPRKADLSWLGIGPGKLRYSNSREYLNLVRPGTAQGGPGQAARQRHMHQLQKARAAKQSTKSKSKREDRPLTGFRRNETPSTDAGSLAQGGSVNSGKRKKKELLQPLTVISKPIVLRTSANDTEGASGGGGRSRATSVTSDPPNFQHSAVAVKVLTIYLGPNWGDLAGVGLTGLQVFRAPTAKEMRDSAHTGGVPIVLQPGQLSLRCLTQDAATPGVKAAVKTAARLLDGRNVTIKPQHMWTFPKNSRVTWVMKLTITFVTKTDLVGLRIWNYNPNLDESFMGVKWLKVEADSQLLSPEQGFLVRKAPGSDLFDYGQTIYFDDDRAHSPRNGSPKAKGSGRWVSGSPKGDNAGRSGFSAQPQSKPDIMTLNDSVGSTGGDDDQFVHADFDTLLGTNDNDRRWGGGAAGSMDNGDQSLGVEELEWPLVEVSQAPQQYVTPLFPTGCMFRFKLLSTCGDVHYIGLNGLELYDESNQLIPLHKKNLEAAPMRDINLLPNSRGDDPRTLEKLADGINNTFDDEHMWLAPYDPQNGNSLFVLFDQPRTISRICLWNYSKTPLRGVSEIEIFVEDSIIYQGVLEKVNVTDPALNPRGAGSERRGSDRDDSIDFTQTILFTNDTRIISAELADGHIYNPQLEENAGGIVFINENERLDAVTASNLTDERPTTSAGRGPRRARGNAQ